MDARVGQLARAPVAHAVVVVVHVLLAAWGAAVAVGDGLTLWYPAAGWAVGVARLGGLRLVPAIVLGEVLAKIVGFGLIDEIGLLRTVTGGVLVGSGFALAGLVLRRIRSGKSSSPDLRDIGTMAAVQVVTALSLAAADVAILRSPEVASAAIGGEVRTWFLGTLVGMLTVAPALVLSVQLHSDEDSVPRPPLRSWTGALEVLSVLLVPAAAVAALDRVDVLYLCLAPVVLVAMRRAHPGSAVAAAVVAGVTVSALSVRGGELDREAVSVLLALVAVTGLVLGVVVSERFVSLRTNERLAGAIERSGDMVAIVALDGWPRWWNPAAERFVAPAATGPRPVWEVLLGGRDRANQLAAQVADRDWWEGDLVLVRDDGTRLPVSASVVPDLDDRGTRTGYTLVARDMSTREAYEDELTRRALHDDLTGIPNRALLMERLVHTIARLRRSGGQASLLLFDLDRFKVVNDSLGHAVGDRLLQAIAVRVSSTLRSSDTIARFGGDEFIVLAEDLDGVHDGSRVAQHILDALHEPFELETGTIVASASIGVVGVTPHQTAEELLRQADLAMYRAKREGGGRYARYEPHMTSSADRRLEIEAAVRTRLEEGRVAVHFQPVVDLRSGATVFVEALLRIDWPGIGLVPPPEAVRVAQETGLLDQMGHVITTTAASYAMTWPDPIAFSINISPAQLDHGGLARDVESVCHATGLDCRRVIVELTEEAFLEDPEHAAAVLRDVRHIGARVALDDFGSGWSSLANLRRLPVDILKLDQSLLAGLEAPDARAVVVAVLGVAEALDLTVVGEGIETDRQREISRALGCDLGQGYGIARPMPSDALIDWLATT